MVREVLEANLEISGAEAGVGQRLAALDAAKARYLPVLDLTVRHSMSKGGREIEIPVGDLMNPIYSTLNDLVAAQGKPRPFSPIDNFSVGLLREEEQSSALLLTQPLFDPLLPAERATESEHLAALGGLDALRGRLTRDVKLAIVIIGGLISSTLLARLVTPVMYKLLPPVIVKNRRRRTRGRRIRSQRGGQRRKKGKCARHESNMQPSDP